MNYFLFSSASRIFSRYFLLPPNNYLMKLVRWYTSSPINILECHRQFQINLSPTCTTILDRSSRFSIQYLQNNVRTFSNKWLQARAWLLSTANIVKQKLQSESTVHMSGLRMSVPSFSISNKWLFFIHWFINVMIMKFHFLVSSLKTQICARTSKNEKPILFTSFKIQRPICFSNCRPSLSFILRSIYSQARGTSSHLKFCLYCVLLRNHSIIEETLCTSFVDLELAAW